MSNAGYDLKSDVAVGEDGWLFLTGGSNDVLRYYTEPDYISLTCFEGWANLLTKRRRRCRELGIEYAHMAVPEKISVYPELTKLKLKEFHQTPCISVPAFLKSSNFGDAWEAWIDLLPFFRSQRERGHQLYWRTDTHWNFIGAFSAYQLLCSFLGAKMNAEILSRGSTISEIVLDLGSKLDPTVTERFEMKDVLKDATRVYANDLVLAKEQLGLEQDAGLHGGSDVAFVSAWPGRDPRRIIIFGDSFSEYRSHLLTGLIAETFSETRFIWSAQIDWAVVEEYKPDIILTELAERFMRYVPSDEEYSLANLVKEKLLVIEAKFRDQV